MEHSSRYIVLFAAAVCAVCSVFVSTAAVSLKERQERNARLDVQRKVLSLAGIDEAITLPLAISAAVIIAGTAIAQWQRKDD